MNKPFLPTRTSYLPKYVPAAGDGCVLWLPGQDDPQSAVLRDRSGNALNATLNGPTWERLGSGLWALKFDGTDDYATVGAPDTAALNPTAATLMVWIRPNATVENYERVIEKAYTTSYYLGANGDGTKWQAIFADAGLVTHVITTTATTVGTWIHLAASHDNSNDRIYVNGSQEDSGANTTELNDTTAAVHISRNPGGAASYIPASIALIRIYNRALTAAEIAWIFRSERHLFGV